MYKTVAAIFATTVYFTKDCKPLLLYSYLLFFNEIFSGQRLSAKKPNIFCYLPQKFWCLIQPNRSFDHFYSAYRNFGVFSAHRNFDRLLSAHRNFDRLLSAYRNFGGVDVCRWPQQAKRRRASVLWRTGTSRRKHVAVRCTHIRRQKLRRFPGLKPSSHGTSFAFLRKKVPRPSEGGRKSCRCRVHFCLLGRR